MEIFTNLCVIHLFNHFVDFELFGYPSCSSWSEIDSNIIAIGTECGFLCIYDVRKVEKCMIQIELHKRIVNNVRFNNR
jgi:hypothetical protein